MTQKKRIHTLDPQFADELLAILRRPGCLEDAGDDEVLATIAVDFHDGVTCDIQVQNGARSDNSPPYVNVNWYEDGEALFAIGSEAEELLGEYDATVEDDQGAETDYFVQVVIGEEGQTFPL